MPVLKVPYKSQRDNKYNPSGSCNVTSIAMCLEYFGARSTDPQTQLEDELYGLCQSAGLSRHDPNDLAYMVNRYYQKYATDTFVSDGSVDDIKKAIDNDSPVVIHGYFTRSGHIIVIKGYDDKGFIVNDPWGEYYAEGYDTSVSGEGLHYSYGLIARTCSPESEQNPTNFWIHTISKTIPK